MGATVLVVLLLFKVLFGLSYVEGASMAPACSEGDLILFQRVGVTYHVGDIVLFEHDGSVNLKRLVAMPGQTVDYDKREQRLLVDGSPLEESYVYMPTVPKDEQTYPMTLGSGEYYVLGDNRTNSMDSRNYGPIRAEQLRGRMLANIRFIKALTYPGLTGTKAVEEGIEADEEKAVLIESFKVDEPVASITVAPGTELGDAGLPTELKAVHKVEKDDSPEPVEEEINVPVTWSGGRFDKDTEGVYTITAVLKADYLYAGPTPYAVVTVSAELAAKEAEEAAAAEAAKEETSAAPSGNTAAENKPEPVQTEEQSGEEIAAAEEAAPGNEGKRVSTIISDVRRILASNEASVYLIPLIPALAAAILALIFIRRVTTRKKTTYDTFFGDL